jgi:hypothetical protein
MYLTARTAELRGTASCESRHCLYGAAIRKLALTAVADPESSSERQRNRVSTWNAQAQASFLKRP